MDDTREPLALYQLLDAIEDFLAFVGDASAAELAKDRMRRYAVERCIEIVSEASRRIPEAWKAEHPDIPWSRIAGIGNILRHDYDDVSLHIIARLRGPPLDDLRAAVLALLAKHDPDGVPFLRR